MRPTSSQLSLKQGLPGRAGRSGVRPARSLRSAFVVAVCLGLAACDQLGIESATAVTAKREAEGKAIGGGCRHAARSIEQCYSENKRADKAAVFAGWREMEDYMRENKLEAVPARPAEALTAKADATDAPAEAAAEVGKSASGSKAAKTSSKPTSRADKTGS